MSHGFTFQPNGAQIAHPPASAGKVPGTVRLQYSTTIQSNIDYFVGNRATLKSPYA